MISNLQTSNTNLRDNLKSAQDDRDAKVAMVNSLQQQLGSETDNRKSLEGSLASARENIERQDFKLRWYADRFPGAITSAQPAHTGQILAADNKANVFVISLGEEDGVKAGFTYIVSRGGQYIATIQISDVQAKQAAGSAIKDISKGDIRRGDKVMNGQ
jgi:chromosome segregation ATPase